MSHPQAAKKVLVVDDEATVRYLLSHVLTHAGYAVEVATDGESALEGIQAGRPDLVVLDLMMPGLDGWGVLERLKASPFRPPVLVVSAHGDSETPGRAAQAGAAGYMTKPFALKKLVETCGQIIAQSPR
jgi:two-component system OmpR family response regulator